MTVLLYYIFITIFSCFRRCRIICRKDFDQETIRGVQRTRIDGKTGRAPEGYYDGAVWS